MTRSVTVLGSTGSIGRATLDILHHAGGADLEALVAGRNVDALIEQARTLRPKLAVVANDAQYHALRDGLSGTGIAVAAGAEAVVEAAQRPADWVMAAIVGTAGLKPALAAAQRGATVALANKEAGAMSQPTRRPGERILLNDPQCASHSRLPGT